MTLKEEFTRVYRENVWGGSGGGAGPEVSEPFATIASDLIRKHNVKRVLDIGCGSAWPATLIDLNGAEYTGVDVVASVIGQARSQHPQWKFIEADALTDSLPDADLVLLKEITQHLSDADIQTLIERLRKYPMVLHCSVAESMNKPRKISDFNTRGVALSLPPFELPGVQPVDHWRHSHTYYFAELWRPNA